MQKQWKQTALCIVLGVLAVWGVLAVFYDRGNTYVRNDSSEAAVQSPNSTTLLFAGDIMLARDIEKTIQGPGEGNYYFPYELIETTIASADIAFANLETSVSNRGTNVGSIYSFRSNPEALPALSRAGFDIVSIANNHIWDWGRDAFADTLHYLDSAGIAYAGGGMDYAEAHEPKIIERNGMKFAFLAYTNLLPEFLLKASSSPAVAFPTVAALAADIEAAKEKGADIVITSFHWGEEYKTKHNEYQELMAKAAIDAGASIVAGHHPHTPQEIEKYKGGLIIYSLGNFVFDQNFDEFTKTGLLVQVTVRKDGVIDAVDSIEIKFNKNYQPYIVGSN